MSKIKQKGSKKIIVRILLIICFIYCFMTPKELTKKYELYAKDVNWENIIINKQGEYVKENEKNKNYEQGIGLAVCQHIKYYYVSKSKEVILVNNNKGYLYIDTTKDKLSKPTKIYKELKLESNKQQISI
ncbi:Uncharacterised protein [uncultured Eubacterium sp.]|nr:Uncharacterised protein [uncultured Eubacterium sp.]